MAKKKKLNIVDADDNIIGEETREKIHYEGLLHREVNVWFYNKNGDVIFQLRKKSQESFPGLLDATAGGHVEIGCSYDETAVKEVKEETGLSIDSNKLLLVDTARAKDIDEVKNVINEKIQARYIYKFDGSLTDLVPTEGERFEVWPVDKILNINEEEKSKFIYSIFHEDNLRIFKKIKEVL